MKFEDRYNRGCDRKDCYGYDKKNNRLICGECVTEKQKVTAIIVGIVTLTKKVKPKALEIEWVKKNKPEFDFEKDKPEPYCWMQID